MRCATPMETMEVLHRDAHVLVVNKPSGLLTHRGWAGDRDTALTRARELAGAYVYPAHRLDRATSGALVLGLTPEVARALGAQLESGVFRKAYLALVRGVAPEAALIDHPLARLDGDGHKDAARERQPARTRVVRLGVLERYSLVCVEPLTGRAHQIRRHLKHVSCPILGDTRYGKGEHNRACRERFGLRRLALHAHAIGFEHPATGAAIELHAPLPEDLAAPLAAMGLLDLARHACDKGLR